MIVLAGPGSGKTMVITHRVSYLIRRAGVNPSEILVVTFTRAAADEMRQRFVSLMKGEQLPVSFGTFHAIFFTILKYSCGYTADNIVTEEKRRLIMRQIAGDMQLGGDNLSEMCEAILDEILYGRLKKYIVEEI
jgi:DNA helicase-2/ATP-dependent DNA helicase PcrA